MTAGTSIEPQRFRDLMAGVCAPVTVVTTSENGQPYGATVSSFASLSLEPPLVTVAFDRRSSMLGRILGARRFGVNLLGHGQADLAKLFAQRGTDRFASIQWHRDHSLPRLDGAAGWIVCELYNVVEGGDHQLLLGHVTGSSRAELPPLVYAHRTFGTHSRYEERPRPMIVDQIAACAR
jgi:flavin reductase (DIM6/NTAB) family NADH-FMN oxidoreductase RutF